MSHTTPPSRLAESVLSLIVRDSEQREAIIGDLREEFSRYSARVGVTRASRWHLRQCLDIAVRYGVMRLLRRKPPVRWISIASMETESPGWSGLGRDVRYAWRAIWQRPSLSLVVITTLAVALAVNSTTFSLMDALVLRPYRFAGVERLIVATTVPRGETFIDRVNVTAADFREWRDQSRTTSQWAMYLWWDANLSGVDIPEQVPGFMVSPGFFSLLSAAPAIGREFAESEAVVGQHRRVVLGHGLWTRRFAADSGIVGKSIRLDGEQYEVVGVAPQGFATPDGAELWAPLALTDEQWANRRAQNYGAFARLNDGASLEAASAELGIIIDRQRQEHPDTNAERFPQVLSFTKGMADPGAGAFIGVSQAAALLLLLIACANIANLLMARGAERSAEYALRLALGASRARIFTQTLLEGLALAALALALAVPLIMIGLGLARASMPASVLRFVPGWNFIRIDTGLFLATALLGTIAMLAFSVLPAIQALRSQVSDTLRQSGRTVTPGRHRQSLRSTLAATQVAFALALLFASMLSITAANETVDGALGFEKDGVLVAELNLPERTYSDPEKRRRFVTDVMRSLEGIPAIADIGATSIIPAAFNNNSRRFFPEGVELKETEARAADFRRVTPGYFNALKIPLRRGRWFDDSDRLESTPAAVISESVARQYWRDADPIGKRFKLAVDGPWLTVVGVSGDTVHNWFTRRSETVYRPLSQEASYSLAFALRTVGDPTALAGDLRRAVAKVDPDQPIATLTTLDQMVEERAAGFAFIASALGIVGVIALVLSVMGIYSLMAFLTAQRTQEIGVRMALGASRWQVVRATTRKAITITLIGAAIGVVLAIGVGRLMESLLFGLISSSMWQLAGLTSVLALVALVAAYIPARRAARIDPMTALRQP